MHKSRIYLNQIKKERRIHFWVNTNDIKLWEDKIAVLETDNRVLKVRIIDALKRMKAS